MNKKIGRFEILKELGRGAQSVVYLSDDAQLQREVAIKTMHFSRTTPEQNSALLAEARMVSKLRHPNIVPIFDAGEEGGSVYLVFEYVPGKTLADFLRQNGAMSAVKAIALLRPVLDGVAAAHARGVIHRDLKPSNILLDEGGTPRVMDFGIASRVEDETITNGKEMSGTPAYMAPEYISHQEVSERSDVFSLGLILYEMLCGQRAVDGTNVFNVMHRLANETIRLPAAGVAIDESLTDILYKALARDPQLRYQSVVQFAEALDDYLSPQEKGATAATGKQATIDFLLRRMRHKSDFPALSESVSAINKIAASETESINKLSNHILKDFALTNKILRLVNAAHFRTAGGGSISTVSRAVIVLGFEAVRNIAITLLLFEHMQNKGSVQYLKEEFLRATFAGILARGISIKAKIREVEQIFICTLFQSLGRLLAQYYFPEESGEVRRLMEQKSCTEDQASMQVLGVTYEDIGVVIARQWGFPSLIVNSMHKLPPGSVRRPVTQEDHLQVLACFSNEICSAIATSTAETRTKDFRKIIGRYGDSSPLPERELHDTVMTAFEELTEFAGVIHLNMSKTVLGRQIREFAYGKAGLGAADAASEHEKDDPDTLGSTFLQPDNLLGAYDGESEHGAPGIDAQAVLTAGIQDISNTLVEGFKLNDILRIILETMYRAMGFKRVILCIKDARGNAMQGRFGFGPEAHEVAKHFRFSLQQAPDIFYAATVKGVDLLISDIDDAKIAARIPDWYRKMVPAKTFVLFPLTLKGNPVALIYADKDGAGEIVMPEKELSLLRTLRNQAILAIKQGS